MENLSGKVYSSYQSAEYKNGKLARKPYTSISPEQHFWNSGKAEHGYMINGKPVFHIMGSSENEEAGEKEYNDRYLFPVEYWSKPLSAAQVESLTAHQAPKRLSEFYDLPTYSEVFKTTAV